MDQKKSLEDFITNAALLAAHLSAQCDKASSEIQQTAATFRQDVADGHAALAKNTQVAVRESLAAEVPASIRGLDEATEQIRRTVEQLRSQQQSLDQRARFLGWKSLASLAVASVVLLAGTGFAAWTNVQRAQSAKVQAEVLQALAQITMTSCDGRPCIKLEDGLQRWSKNDDYVLVDTAAATMAAPLQ